jgi:hypothetical protein
MNRCAVCDVTDEDNPKAGVRWIEVVVPEGYDPSFEPRCVDCHSSIQESIEDLNIADEDFSFAEK